MPEPDLLLSVAAADRYHLLRMTLGQDHTRASAVAHVMADADAAVALQAQLGQLRAAVRSYLSQEFPEGTEHPADLAADRLRAAAGLPRDYWSQPTPPASTSPPAPISHRIDDVEDFDIAMTEEAFDAVRERSRALRRTEEAGGGDG